MSSIMHHSNSNNNINNNNNNTVTADTSSIIVGIMCVGNSSNVCIFECVFEKRIRPQAADLSGIINVRQVLLSVYLLCVIIMF